MNFVIVIIFKVAVDPQSNSQVEPMETIAGGDNVMTEFIVNNRRTKNWRQFVSLQWQIVYSRSLTHHITHLLMRQRGPHEWNGLPDNIKNIKEIDIFKRTLFSNTCMFHMK